MGTHSRRFEPIRALKSTFGHEADDQAFWAGVLAFWLIAFVVVALLDQSIL
jgi:hypothetical protein